eukprot:Seg1019.15 transcript_id=Seg1019.15/GoldUCD/mRNA.D3Y31 product="Proline-rich protein 11" protein_id=Seg1019.15/GoldUCD/D3Y31
MGITIYSKSYQNLLSILHSCTETAVTAQEKFEIFNVAVAVTLNFGGLLEARENNSACKHFHFAPREKYTNTYGWDYYRIKMPTSRARKNRLVSRQKLKQKVALQSKSKPGLKVTQRSVSQRKSRISNALQTILKYLKVTGDDLNKQSCSPTSIGNRETYQMESGESLLHKVKHNDFAGEGEGQEKIAVAAAPDCNAANQAKEDQMAVKIDFENELNEMEMADRSRGKEDSEFQSSSKSPVLLMNSLLNLGLLPLKFGKRIAEALKSLISGPSLQIQNSQNYDDLVVRVSLLEKEVADLNQHLKEKKKRNIPKKTAACVTESKKSQSGLQITNDQLLKVKLRRVSFKAEHAKKTSGKGVQLVTLDDLKGVRLRKTPSKTAGKNGLSSKSSTPLRDMTNFTSGNTLKKSADRRTPISGYNLRRTLRKVNVIRSPGGTPLVKSKMETGVGITPLLTAALKRKFQNANQPSLENTPEF